MNTPADLIRLLSREPLLPVNIKEYRWVCCASGESMEFPHYTRGGYETCRVAPRLAGNFGETRFRVRWDEESRVAVLFGTK